LQALLPDRDQQALKLAVKAIVDFAQHFFAKRNHQSNKVLGLCHQVSERTAALVSSAVFMIAGMEKLKPSDEVPPMDILNALVDGRCRFVKNSEDLIRLVEELHKENVGSWNDDQLAALREFSDIPEKTRANFKHVLESDLWADSVAKAARFFIESINEKSRSLRALCCEKHSGGTSSWKGDLDADMSTQREMMDKYLQHLEKLEGGKIKDECATMAEDRISSCVQRQCIHTYLHTCIHTYMHVRIHMSIIFFEPN
jgi:hypothetical protein